MSSNDIETVNEPYPLQPKVWYNNSKHRNDVCYVEIKKAMKCIFIVKNVPSSSSEQLLQVNGKNTEMLIHCKNHPEIQECII